MTCEYVNKNITTEAQILYNHEDTDKRVKAFMTEHAEHRESTFTLHVISTLVLVIISALVVGIALFKRDVIFPVWMTSIEIALMLCGAIIVLILTKLSVDYIINLDAPYFPICPEIIYFRELSDKKIIETSLTIGKANEFASILFIAEDKDHCITYKRIEFDQVIFKTDINEIQIDINGNKVYIPYETRSTEEGKVNDKND